MPGMSQRTTREKILPMNNTTHVLFYFRERGRQLKIWKIFLLVKDILYL
jgi:hypothetical protein